MTEKQMKLICMNHLCIQCDDVNSMIMRMDANDSSFLCKINNYQIAINLHSINICVIDELAAIRQLVTRD